MPATTTNDDRTPWDVPPDSTEVLVVGAGVAGASVARGLARRGAAVVLVDPDAPREGASRRGSGLVYTGLSEHPARVAEALGPERGEALYRLARGSLGLLGELATPAEQLWVAVDAREEQAVDESLATLAGFGFDVRPIDADALAARGVTGRRGFVMDGDGLVDPRQALDQLVHEARTAGARICRGRVVAVDEDPLGLLVSVDGRPVRAEVVVYAAGNGAIAVEPYFEGKLWSVREQALRIRGDLPRTVGRAGYGWTWFRPMPGGIGVGGCRWATPHLEVGETDAIPTDVVQGRIEAFARKHLAPEARVDARWAWIETHSCDGLPIVGPLPGQVRRIACTGFCGNDWGLGPAAAAQVVDGLLGGPADTPPMFAASRFMA